MTTYRARVALTCFFVDLCLGGCWRGDGVGTVYGTGIALTILQLPYSFAPIYQR